MRIVVTTIGSRGDVQPYINLCQGLQEVGHDVVLATNPTLCSLVEAHSVRSVSVGSPADMEEIGERIVEQSFGNMYIGAIRVMGIASSLVEEAHSDVVKACEGADLVIVSDTGSGIAEAEKLGIPWISVTLQPMRVPKENPTPSLFERLVWGLVDKLMILPINRARKRMGAPLVTDIAGMQSKHMLILPVNRHVALPDPRWPKHVRQTNYWYARPLRDWTPPQDLLAFLQTGEKPIAVSLGVMSRARKNGRDIAKVVLEAIHQAGVRAIVQGWDGAYQESASSETTYFAGSLPHSWLFDQVSAVIHHGGFGTTAAVFRAGVPGIVIPHILDQFYWGQQVFLLGLGPKPVVRGKLNVPDLQQAIRQALSDMSIREKAAELGRSIRAEPDGITTAVSMIEGVV